MNNDLGSLNTFSLPAGTMLSFVSKEHWRLCKSKVFLFLVLVCSFSRLLSGAPVVSLASGCHLCSFSKTWPLQSTAASTSSFSVRDIPMKSFPCYQGWQISNMCSERDTSDLATQGAKAIPSSNKVRTSARRWRTLPAMLHLGSKSISYSLNLLVLCILEFTYY